VTSSTPRRPRDEGFTLLEVLVALVVLSTTVVAVLQLFGGGLRLARAAGDHADAALIASAKLADLEPGILAEGVTEGTDGPYRWTRRVTLDPELLPVQPDTPDAMLIRLARVNVEVRWGQGRRFELVTLRAWRIAS
jgi:prepilin-type N-terminal cleavage/methylation domain-containing protein